MSGFRTHAKSAPDWAELLIFVAGTSAAGVVGGVLGGLSAIAAAAILYKTCRVLAAKKRSREELVMLGGGMTARVRPPPPAPTTSMLLGCFVQARPLLPRLEPPSHSSGSTSPWRSLRCVRACACVRLNARRVRARACAHAIKRPRRCTVGELPASTCASRLDIWLVGMARTRWCGRVLQLVPYVKMMFGAVMTLEGACSQAVHNKERCIALAECVRLGTL